MKLAKEKSFARTNVLISDTHGRSWSKKWRISHVIPVQEG